jgi:hypothetical protein
MQEQDFPCWSARTIERLVIKLEERGLLLSGEFNKFKRDRTKWYTVVLDHPVWSRLVVDQSDKVADSNPTNCGTQESDKMADSNQKSTSGDYQEITEFSDKPKTVDAIAAEQGLGNPLNGETFEFDEETCYSDLDPTNGTDVSKWWRTCLRGYGHSKKMQPEMTGKDQKQLKTLLKQLGPGGGLRVMVALKHWVEYKKHADKEFGMKSTVKPVIQKFIMGRNAIAAFDPPKDVDWSAKEWKTL